MEFVTLVDTESILWNTLSILPGDSVPLYSREGGQSFWCFSFLIFDTKNKAVDLAALVARRARLGLIIVFIVNYLVKRS